MSLFYKGAILFHDISESGPGKAVLVDRVVGWEPLEVALTHKKSTEFPPVDFHLDISVLLLE